MSKIYKVKEGKTIKDFLPLEDNGFEVNAINEMVLKQVNQSLYGEAVNFLLKNIYNNPEWKKKFYDKNKKMFLKEYKLKYKNGEIVMNESFEKLLTTWFLIIEMEDGWVGFTHCDKRNRMVYYGSKVIEKYCPSELFMLLSNGLIEEVEITESEEEINA